VEQAQRIAARTVRRVLAGSALPLALASVGGSTLDNRALIQELAYGTLRFLGQLRAVVRHLADRPLSDPNVEALLWVALYQLIHTGAPAHAVVNAAVQATVRAKKSSARGLTNAILRSFLRRRDALLAAIGQDDEARFSYPQWWIDRVREEYRERAPSVLDSGNTRPPLTLRITRRALSRERYIGALAAQGIAAESIGEAGVILAQARAVTTLPGYAEGWFMVQDASAQLAAPLLGVDDGMRVLDVCAAPGGKTAHLAELAAIDLVALDIDATRLERVAQNLARLELRARLIVADAADTATWWDGLRFDRILLDAPCTASGIVRRHPDGKWLRRESDIAAFAAQQRRVLEAVWPCLARGGRLLYGTCSIFRAENSDRIAAFMAGHDDVLRLPLLFPAGFHDEEGQLLPSGAGTEHNHDGFFYALLQKK
jgi:16S rRNA (cytosine967-C5)-methyltransferase